MEVSDEVAAKITLDFGAFFEVRPTAPSRMGVADALKAAGVSDKVIGRLEVAGLMGPQLLAADADALVAVKGIGKASAAQVLEALNPIRG